MFSLKSQASSLKRDQTKVCAPQHVLCFKIYVGNFIFRSMLKSE